MLISIICPTNRSSIHVIGNLLRLSEAASDDTEVIVHDNSDCEEKQQLLSGLKLTNFRYVKSTSTDAHGNFLDALNCAQGQYVAFVGDDDLVVVEHLKSYKEILRNKETAGLVCRQLNYSISAGISCEMVDRLDRSSLAARVSGLSESKVGNIMMSAFVKREIAIDVLYGLSKVPIKFAHLDWLWSLGYLSFGSFLMCDNLWYIKNNQNWTNNIASKNIIKKHYSNLGLPQGADKLHFLISAIEGIATLKNFKIPSSSSLELTNAYFNWAKPRFAAFLANSDQSPEVEDLKLRECLSDLRDDLTSVKEVNIVGLFLRVEGLLEDFNLIEPSSYTRFWAPGS